MEKTRTRNPQALLVLLAMAFAVAAIWAATALAGGSTSASSDPAGGQPAAELVQSEEDAVPADEDCPEGEGGFGGGPGGSESDPSGSSSSDF